MTGNGNDNELKWKINNIKSGCRRVRHIWRRDKTKLAWETTREITRRKKKGKIWEDNLEMMAGQKLKHRQPKCEWRKIEGIIEIDRS